MPPAKNLTVETQRLRLFPLPLGPLALLVESRSKMEQTLGLVESGLRFPQNLEKDLRDLLPVQLQKVALAPHLYPWYSNWEIILRAENRTIGGMGLAGQPDDEGKVFVGYWIDERYQRRGYMTEALEGLVSWVFQCPEALLVTASTPADNVASKKVLVKNGFKRQGEYDGHPFYVKTRTEPFNP